MSDKKNLNKKQKQAFENAFETYNSDQDLTPSERSEIQYSENPAQKRKEIWEKKSSWDKLKKSMKGGFYGGDKSGK